MALGGNGGAVFILAQLSAHGVAVLQPGVDHVVVALLNLAGNEPIQQNGLSDAVGGGGAGIEAHAEATVLPRQEADHGAEAGVAAGVVDNSEALVVAVEPAMGVAYILHGEVLLGGSSNHRSDQLFILGFRAQSLSAGGDAAPGHGHDPLGHVLHADADAAAGCGVAVSKIGAALGGIAVAAVRKGGADLIHIAVDAPEADLIHAQRLGNIFDDLVLPGHTAPHALFQISQQDEKEVIVLVTSAESRVGLHQGDLAHDGLPVDMELIPHHIVGGNAGAVADHVPDSQVFAGILVVHLKLGDVLLDGGVPAGNEAFVNGLGRQHGGPCLGGGGHVTEGILGEGNLVFPVSIAVVVGIDDFAVLHNADCAAHKAGFLRNASKCLFQSRSYHVFTHSPFLLLISYSRAPLQSSAAAAYFAAIPRSELRKGRNFHGYRTTKWQAVQEILPSQLFFAKNQPLRADFFMQHLSQTLASR